jgi:hypothetical protein
MRFTWRLTALILLLVVLVVPLTAYASNGKCPDDLELSKDCNPDTPPYYVVINRAFEDLDRAGSGCQPFILEHPECEDCCSEEGWSEDCTAAVDDALDSVVDEIVARTDWAAWPNGVILYVMCCDCGTPEGEWVFSIYTVYSDGTYEPDPDNQCNLGLPPRTGIDLPAPVIVGGLALLGVALVATGVVVRRRSLKLA